MPVRKYRSFEEAVVPDGEPLHPNNLRRAFELSELCMRLGRVTRRPGVKKFRTLEEADRAERET